MTILYVTHYSALFGANRALLELIEEGRKRGIKPVVVTLLDGDLVNELKKQNIPCYIIGGYPWTTKINCPEYIRVVKQARNMIINRLAVKKTVDICRKYNVDIIHTNSSVVNIGAEAAKVLKIPHVWHLREFGDEDYNLEFYIGKRKAVEYIEQNSQKIITISNVVYQHYAKYSKDKSKWQIVYDGVDSNNYILSSRYPEKKLSIAFMGVLQENKNQIELLKALKLLSDNEGVNDFEVYFIGSGGAAYTKRLKDFSMEAGILDNIHFVGNVPDVRKYLGKCNIGVTASKKEAFGRVTIEYMYAGLCVIASSTGANIEIIPPECAVLYEYGNEIDLYKKLVDLLYNPEKIIRIAEQGKKMALLRYSSERNMDGIMEVYKSL